MDARITHVFMICGRVYGLSRGLLVELIYEKAPVAVTAGDRSG